MNRFTNRLVTEVELEAQTGGALVAVNNLSDLTNAATARNNLGLSDVMYGANNLSEITDANEARTNLGLEDALLGSNNLSDVANAVTARTNLGIVDPLGVGQTWQDVTGSRSISTTFTNTTGRPIMVAVGVNLNNTTSFTSLIVAGVNAARTMGPGAGLYTYDLIAVVPNGATYRVDSGTLSTWRELR